MHTQRVQARTRFRCLVNIDLSYTILQSTLAPRRCPPHASAHIFQSNMTTTAAAATQRHTSASGFHAVDSIAQATANPGDPGSSERRAPDSVPAPSFGRTKSHIYTTHTNTYTCALENGHICIQIYYTTKPPPAAAAAAVVAHRLHSA